MSEITEIDQLAIEILLISGRGAQTTIQKLTGESTRTLRDWRNQAYQTTLSLEDLKHALQGRFSHAEVSEIIAMVHLYQFRK